MSSSKPKSAAEEERQKRRHRNGQYASYEPSTSAADELCGIGENPTDDDPWNDEPVQEPEPKWDPEVFEVEHDVYDDERVRKSLAGVKRAESSLSLARRKLAAHTLLGRVGMGVTSMRRGTRKDGRERWNRWIPSADGRELTCKEIALALHPGKSEREVTMLYLTDSEDPKDWEWVADDEVEDFKTGRLCPSQVYDDFDARVDKAAEDMGADPGSWVGEKVEESGDYTSLNPECASGENGAQTVISEVISRSKVEMPKGSVEDLTKASRKARAGVHRARERIANDAAGLILAGGGRYDDMVVFAEDIGGYLPHPATASDFSSWRRSDYLGDMPAGQSVDLGEETLDESAVRKVPGVKKATIRGETVYTVSRSDWEKATGRDVPEGQTGWMIG